MSPIRLIRQKVGIVEWNDYNGGKRHYSYARADEFATKEEILRACENDFAENKRASGCVTFIAITLLGLATLAGTLIVSIKWA